MKNLLTILVSLGLFLGGLTGAGTLTGRINHERQEQNLTVSDTIYDLPPEMAVMQAALGTFRGLAINILWERAETLKNQGKFHEAIELGKLITRLQPRYPKVWEFVSWNLAYNISSATHTPEERWIWVKSGVDLLQSRGGGIDANPNELAIYQQLGWIYYHKIGEFSDNMSWHYKRELADIWHSILGTPPRGQADYLRWFDQVLNAPDRIEDLPPGARTLAEWLIDNHYAFDRHTLRAFTVPTRFEDPAAAEALANRPVSPLPGEQAAPPPKIVPQLAWPQGAAQQDIDAVLAFVRKKAITSDELNMDPAVMRRYAERFGPIDWRHPGAHNLYWSQLGLERLKAEDGRQMDNEINTKRNVLNALERLAHSGQVVYVPAPSAGDSFISFLPGWNYWLAYDDYFQRDVLDDPRHSSQALEESFAGGHRSKMNTAIAATYAFGDEAAADMLYRRMHERVKDNPAIRPEYEVPLSDFAFRQYQASMDQPQIVRGLIIGLITQSITDTVVHRNPKKAEAELALSRRIFDEYRRLNPNPNDPLYKEVPDYEMLHITSVASFVAGSAGPAGLQSVPLSLRAGVYRTLPDEIKAMIYLQSGRDLANETAAEGLEMSVVFPPPPQKVIDEVARRFMQAQPGGQGADAARPEVR